MKRILYHLNPEQQRQLQEWLDKQTGARTPSDDYIRENNKFAKIQTCKRPTQGSIGCCDKSYNGEVKPHVDFNAKRDIAPGWGITSMYDSGGNYAIVNAAQSIHTALWNFWTNCDAALKEQLHERIPLAKKLRAELEANNIYLK